MTFQKRVQKWMHACFGEAVSADKLERGDRFLEETFELLQSVGYPRERISSLEDYVYSRPVGDPPQEVGGVMVTLAAFCEPHDLDMHVAGENELVSCWGKIEKIRAKQAAKPHGSALPIAVSPPPQSQMTGPTDTQLLDALASNYWDLRCVDVPTGGDDADIDWIVIEHHQGKPSEVEVDRAYKDDPRLAIRRALRASDKNAARCVSCDEVLHEGDSVFYEHGEGGHIHSWCASDDPESFVDVDEVHLRAGDEIPKPFAYSVARFEGSEAPSPATNVTVGHLRAQGIGRDPQNDRVVFLSLNRSPNGDELRAINDAIRRTPATCPFCSKPTYVLPCSHCGEPDVPDHQF